MIVVLLDDEDGGFDELAIFGLGLPGEEAISVEATGTGLVEASIRAEAGGDRAAGGRFLLRLETPPAEGMSAADFFAFMNDIAVNWMGLSSYQDLIGVDLNEYFGLGLPDPIVLTQQMVDAIKPATVTVQGGDITTLPATHPLGDAGIAPSRIDAAWLSVAFDAVNIGPSGIPLAMALRLPDIGVTKVENYCASGTESFRGAVYAVASGAADIALALGVEKLKDTGYGSFKGSGFVRGGIYDRVQVAQEMDTFTFRDLDYLNLYGVEAKDAPAYREAGIFIIRSTSFSGAYPWNLVFLANKINKQTGERTFTSFDKEYWLPARYLVGGHPAYERPEPVWLKIWKDKAVIIVLFALMLAITAAVYSQRDKLVRRAARRDKRWVSIPKITILSISGVFVGYYLMAQPSITHVLTWAHSLVYKWQWELFLSDPFIFIFWWFFIITVFIWGRGLFCGWLCPYGAHTELVCPPAPTARSRHWSKGSAS